MSNIVIEAEDLAKQYRLGQVGRRTLSHDVNRWWHTLRGKEDPYLKIGQENNRATKGESEYVWALKDINFSVKEGEVLGIIGRNGAGKSTLLKILSKVTAPTSGQVKIRGRIASLLEVGTGFHPELSGKENIFLNGAILGMTKKEVSARFDEIVDFAGVERYIDTPVKRYSSGMYVRLAFAVAAHLEPEILIIDEVLAVGDAEFQKKCLGKMKDVSEKDGRTVLFVSHNMGSVQSLCSHCFLLNQGRKFADGSVAEVTEQYAAFMSGEAIVSTAKQLMKGAVISDYAFYVNGTKSLGKANLLMGQRLKISLEIMATDAIRNIGVAVDIWNSGKELFSHLINEDEGFIIGKMEHNERRKITIETSPLFYAPGIYTLDLWIGEHQSDGYFRIKNALQLTIEQSSEVGRNRPLPKNMKFYLQSAWSVADFV